MGLIMGLSFVGNVRREMIAPAMQLCTLFISVHCNHMIYHTLHGLQTWYGFSDSRPVADLKQPIHFSSSIQIPIKCLHATSNGYEKINSTAKSNILIHNTIPVKDNVGLVCNLLTCVVCESTEQYIVVCLHK